MSLAVKIDRFVEVVSAPAPCVCAACGRQIHYCAPCVYAWLMIMPDVFVHIVPLCQSCSLQKTDKLPERICEYAVRQIQHQPAILLTTFERDLQRAIKNQLAP